MDQFACQVIADLGGTAETGRLFEVSSAAVSQWRENGIPKDKLKLLRLTHPDVITAVARKLNEEVAEVTAEHLREASGQIGRSPPDVSKLTS